ncbi:hypothetical protein [Streptomyces sp. NBC_01750]|uniref:hypothetical protein n=1 Tax=Streptomyces sp. NBC_01750 TaxID=2975928 RepID=UPI002DD9EA62|nr:hypothetical protein [Streptomyces sp. NBC_01750]WSD30673.1 hypothetical protein OG966_00965 [Streptomyces sp. NBC_01750]
MSHTRVSVLRDDPATARSLLLEGVFYDSTHPTLPGHQRLPWLDRVPTGFAPQPYEQLAATTSVTVAPQGAYDLDTIVAVGDRDRGVVPPCGRCRQVLLDYFPTLKVIIGASDSLRTVSITDLLPESYIWADHQLDAEQSAPISTS